LIVIASKAKQSILQRQWRWSLRRFAPCNDGNPFSRHLLDQRRRWLFALEFFQAAVPRFDAERPDGDDLQQQQSDHQRHHTGDAVGFEQHHHQERRYDGGAAAERVDDAGGAKPHFGREQLGDVDAEQ
jgi:hypothetical protein